jgi:hypothetical protein
MTATATFNSVVRTTTNARAANVLWRAQTLFGAPLTAGERKFLEVLAWRDGLTPVQRELIGDYFCARKEERKDPDDLGSQECTQRLWARLHDLHAYEAWLPYALYGPGEEDYILKDLCYQAG